MKSHTHKTLSGKANSTSFRKERSHSFFNSTDSFFSSKNSSAFIQPKLSINKPNDVYEQEADRVANAVVNSPATSPLSIQQKPISQIQRKCKACEEEEHEIQKKGDGNASTASPQLSSRIESSSGNGSVLPAGTLTDMNNSFGADFSGVRIHTDSASAQMSREINAQAFTHGSDIYFNAGKYNPETKPGKELLAHELTHVIQQGQAHSPGISRKISVDNPTNNIPNPSGTGVVQTNIDAVLEYISQLCPDTDFLTSGASIEFLDTGFCFPSEKQEDGTFKSPSELSAHPVSCDCLCEMIMDPLQNIIIRIDDSSNGNASANSMPGGAVITVPSPNMKAHDVRGETGETIGSPNFIVLGHELCGHHFLEKRGSNERENAQNTRGGHDPTIKRENLIRDEHGLDKRGTFRDPCCGLFESTDQDLKKASGKCGDQFEKQKDEKGTVAYECKHWRDEYNKLNGTNFTTDDKIPEEPLEEAPATWRIEIEFNKDMPQAWNTLQESLTDDGKDALEVVVILLNRHPEFSGQLAGNASSDKPAGDPTYNTRLANRRVKLVLQDLLERSFDRNRFKTFDSDCERLEDGVHNCSDTESQAKTNALDRNVEVKLF